MALSSQSTCNSEDKHKKPKQLNLTMQTNPGLVEVASTDIWSDLFLQKPTTPGVRKGRNFLSSANEIARRIERNTILTLLH